MSRENALSSPWTGDYSPECVACRMNFENQDPPCDTHAFGQTG